MYGCCCILSCWSIASVCCVVYFYYCCSNSCATAAAWAGESKMATKIERLNVGNGIACTTAHTKNETNLLFTWMHFRCMFQYICAVIYMHRTMCVNRGLNEWSVGSRGEKDDRRNGIIVNKIRVHIYKWKWCSSGSAPAYVHNIRWYNIIAIFYFAPATLKFALFTYYRI